MHIRRFALVVASGGGWLTQGVLSASLAASTLGAFSHETADMSADTPPSEPNTPGGYSRGKPNKTIERRSRDSLFDRLFSDADNEVLQWDNFKRTFDSGGFMTTEFRVASVRNAQAGRACAEAFVVLQRTAPGSVPPEIAAPTASPAASRKRVLVCQLSNSTDVSIRSGECDRVGQYMLVREEPHTSFKGNRTNGNDVDVLRVYLFLDELYRNGDLPKEIVPTLVYDLGGHLFANVEYFSNPNPENDVEKAEDADVQTASAALMATIIEAADGKKVPRVVTRDLAFYKALADKD